MQLRLFVGCNLYFNPNSGVGGVIHQANSVLKKLNWEVDCFFRQHCLRINTPSIGYLLYPLAAAKIAREGNYDIAHFHLAKSGYLYGLSKKAPFVMTSHGCDWTMLEEFVEEVKMKRIPCGFNAIKEFFYLKMSATQEMISVKNADKIITVSNSAAEDIRSRYRVPPHRFEIIHNGVDSKLFSPNAGMIPWLSEIYQPKIIFVGSCNWAKGVYYLLRAFHKVSKKVRDAILIIIGCQYESLIKQGFSPQKRKMVIVLPFVENEKISRYYNSCDIFVSPSLHEGHSLSIMEAMACEKPVICTDVSDNSQIIGQDECGLIVPPRDIEALAYSIIYLLENPSEARRMGEAGRKKVKQQFTWEKAISKTLNVYECLTK